MYIYLSLSNYLPFLSFSSLIERAHFRARLCVRVHVRRALEPFVNLTRSASRSKECRPAQKLIMQDRYGVQLNSIRAYDSVHRARPGHDPTRPILSDIWGTLEF